MFQWDYAIAVLLVGALVGTFTHRSTITQAVLVLASFTSTFGFGWGAVTLIELAVGYWIGNALFGRKTSKSKNGPNPRGADNQTGLGNSHNVGGSLRITRSLQSNRQPAVGGTEVYCFVGDTIVCRDCETETEIDRPQYVDATTRHSATIKNISRRGISGPAVQMHCPNCGGANIRTV